MRAFVIAMRCEADAVEPHLKQGDRLYVAGIGKVNAAAATQKAICEGADEIWNAGLCGGFGDDVEVGDIFTVDRAVEYDFDLAKLNCTRVGQLNEYDTPYLPFAPVKGLPARTLATGDHFNDDTADLPLLERLGVGLRDMEGAAIAQVCERAGVPCRSLKCVTNVLGSGATAQYAENLKRCLNILTAALAD